MELKNNAPEYCLSLDNKGDLIIYTGKNKDLSKPINTYDVIAGDSQNINADDVATELANQEPVPELKQVINREPKEAIIVLLDVSGSMSGQYLNEEGINRIGAVKAFFTAFAERTQAYDLHHVISLIFFNHQIKMICDFTEVLNQFKHYIDTAKANGTTLLYDSIIYAVEKLNLFRVRYPNCTKRIICLTDGEDIGSKNTSWKAAGQVQESGIILDSFVVGDNCEGLKKITFATGILI